MNIIEYKIIIKSYQKQNIINKQAEIKKNLININKRQMWLNVKYNINKLNLYKQKIDFSSNGKNKGTVGLISSPFVHKKGGKSFKEQMYTGTISLWQNKTKKDIAKKMLLQKIIGTNIINNKYELKIEIKEHVK